MNKSLLECFRYENINTQLAGFGLVLIDVNAFIDYLSDQNQNQNESNQEMNIKANKFIKEFKNYGFNRIELFLFEEYFNKATRYSKLDLDAIFKDQCLKLFINNADTKWISFISNERISTIITNLFLKCSDKNKNDEFIFNSYIKTIARNNEIRVSLLDNISFIYPDVKAFILSSNLFICDEFLKNLSYDRTFELKEVNIQKQVEANFQKFELKNESLNKILSNCEEKIIDESKNVNCLSWQLESNWMIKLNDRREEYKKFFKRADDPLIQNQKYSRFIERYSESLNSSKNLHYVIIKSSSSVNDSQKTKPIKISKKEEEIREKIKEKKAEEQAKKDQELIKKLEKEIDRLSFEQKVAKLDNQMEIACANRSDNYLLSLKQLKLRIFNKYHKYEVNISLKLSLMIKELIESHSNQLSSAELSDYISTIKSNDFKETAHYLSCLYQLSKEKPLLPRSVDIDSFNKEIYLQLKYNGDKLKRSVNSRVDKRVKFMPDEWQVELLNVVDNDESALVCCPTSSGKTFICFYAMEKILRSPNSESFVFSIKRNNYY
jgi:hypothetical protein